MQKAREFIFKKYSLVNSHTKNHPQEAYEPQSPGPLQARGAIYALSHGPWHILDTRRLTKKPVLIHCSCITIIKYILAFSPENICLWNIHGFPILVYCQHGLGVESKSPPHTGPTEQPPRD